MSAGHDPAGERMDAAPRLVWRPGLGCVAWRVTRDLMLRALGREAVHA